VDGWPQVSGYAGTAATRMLSRIAVLFRDQQTPAKYDYTRVMMVVKRCGFYAILLVLPDHSFPPLPRVSKMPTTGGMISRFHLPMRAHPRHADAPTAVTHVTRAPPTAPGHGQQKQPVATTGADITAAPP